jgi:hypothetical protein
MGIVYIEGSTRLSLLGIPNNVLVNCRKKFPVIIICMLSKTVITGIYIRGMSRTVKGLSEETVATDGKCLLRSLSLLLDDGQYIVFREK